ncbi:MAG: choice-of-anchor L domain-containing protein [Bacteroidales bacterium]|nr:choice-of-anchor L domain-containing protein [Bacteroidales bacterium]
MKRLYIAVIAVVMSLLPLGAMAQLQVTVGSSLPSGWTADSLVRHVLMGEGVEVSNVRFNGSTGVINCTSIGKFTTGTNPTGIGIQSGIIMGSGNVSVAVGPNNSGSASNDVGKCASYSNAQLLNIANGSSVNDCAVLEFDFIPRSDMIEFRYVFASEEYNEYVGSQFNDVFGFFISGINPRGGMYNNTNIALVPGTTTPIAINNVNNNLNSTYYHDNANSSSSPIQYDGYTTVLTAKARVLPCTQYHLVMAIGDVSDAAFDSGVFLEANSLTSNAMEFTFVNPANPGAVSDLYEGCEARIILHRPQTKDTITEIGVIIEGTATNGIDFPAINPVFVFPANTDSMELVIAPYKDGIAEGVETVKIVLSPSDGCERADSVEFQIIDVEPLTASITRDTITSWTTSIMLHANVTGGMPNRSFEWVKLNSPNTTWQGQDIRINLTNYQKDTILLRVQDSCYNYGEDTVVIGLRKNFAFLTRDTLICKGEKVNLSIVGADSCVWYKSGDGTPIAIDTNAITVEPDMMTRYVVHSYMWWAGILMEDIDSMLVMVVPLPEVHVTASTQRLCKGQSVTITGSGTGTFSWDGGNTFVQTTSHSYLPDSTTMYVIYGLTTAGECAGKDSVLITVDTIPDIYLDGPAGVCGGEDVALSVTTTAESVTWSSNPTDPDLIAQADRRNVLVNPQQTTVYTLYAVNGTCNNTSSMTVAVEPNPIAIGDVSPKTVSLGQMEAIFTDMSEHATTCKWEFPDGTIKTESEVSYIVPDDVDSVSVRLWAYNPYFCFDTTTVTVYVDHTTLWLPNAFTPDESTNNTFLVKMNDVQRYHIFIYNRQGQLVFESTDPEEAWNGTNKNGVKCPQGVYTYLVSCHKITYPFEQIVRKGTVMLVR